MSFLRQQIQALLRTTGYQLCRYFPEEEKEKAYLRRKHLLALMETARINVVIDVGANNGQYGRGLRHLGYRGEIISFEPLPTVFAELQQHAANDRSWHCHCLALGDRDETMELQVAGNLDSSSLLRMNAAHVEAAPESAVTGAQSVRVQRLDRVELPRIERPQILLKIDTQGYEKQVLLGATEILPQIGLLDLELSLVELYQNQPLLPEMLSFLDQVGFAPVSLENAFVHPRSARALQIEGIFARKDLSATGHS